MNPAIHPAQAGRGQQYLGADNTQRIHDVTMSKQHMHHSLHLCLPHDDGFVGGATVTGRRYHGRGIRMSGVSRVPGVRMSWCKGVRVSGCQGVRVSGCQIARVECVSV